MKVLFKTGLTVFLHLFVIRFVIIAVFLSAPILGISQFNDSTHYYVGLASTGTYNKTNTNTTFLLSNTLRAGIRQKKYAFNTMNKFLYGENGLKLVNRDLTSVWDFNYYTKVKRLYAWSLLTYNSIYSLKVNHQLQSGFGLAYDVIDNQKVQINISDGILYDFSEVVLNDSTNDKYQTFRNSFRLQCKVTAGNLNFRVAGFIQNSFEYKSDFIIKSDAILAYRLRKILSLTMQASYNRMNRTGRETLFITYGLSFEKYF